MGCNGFTRIRKDNVCNFCAKINNSKLMERKHLNHQQSNNIARRRGRPARRGRGRGRGGRVAISSGNRCTSPRESRLKLLDVDVVLHRVDEDQLLQSVQISSYGDEDVNVEDFDDNLNLTKESCFSEEQDVDKSNFDAANDDDTDYCQLVRKSEGGENPECRGGTCSVIPSLPCVTFGSGDTHEGPRQTTSMPQGKRRVGRPRKHPPVGGESSSASPSVPHLTFGSENAGKTPAQQVKRCVGRPRKHSPELCEQNIAHLSVPSTTCDRADKELSPSLCSTDQVHFESSGATNHSHTLSDLSKGKVLCSGKRANQGRKPRPYNKQKEVDWCLENKLSSFDIKSAPADDPCSSTANDITDAACHTTTDLLDIAERHASYQQFIASKSPSQDISAQPIKTLFLPVPQSESSLSFQSADSEQTSSFGLVDFSSGNLKPTQNTHLTSSPDFCTPPASGFAVSSVLGTHQTAYSCMTKPENSVNSTCLNKHETLAGSSWPLSSSLQTSYQVESFPVSSQTSFSSQAVNFASSSQLVTPELQCFSSTLSKPSCSLASGLFETPHNLMTLTTAPVVSSMASEMVESSETSMEDVWENNSPQVAWSAVADRPVPVSLFAHGCPPIPSNPLTSVSQSELQTVTSNSDSDVEDISHSVRQSTEAVLAKEKTRQPVQSLCSRDSSRQFSPYNEWKKKCVIPSIPPRRTATSTSVSATTFLTTTPTAVPMPTSASSTSALVEPYGISTDLSASRFGEVVRGPSSNASSGQFVSQQRPILAYRKQALSSIIDLTTDDCKPPAMQRGKNLVMVVESSDSEIEFLESW
ncbi:hypothetical protein C0Q70_14429 [Pomacea canaliculata]|uniref:Uncharacterized protein n=1 Tax=Pomacea canaliculata TaxID=400727 RepID=A0A2T7P012_POMCA|nr:hypothetical protein C0Q70_14429 [Pomacea canaliculata]